MTEIFGDPEGTYAKVIADSVNESGDRLTTMEVQFHRFVLAEFNTHRAFSRNSASSRAIPVSKQIERIRRATAYPVSFPAEQSGMQGGADLTPHDVSYARGRWRLAAIQAVAMAEELHELGVHKSVTNRLLEPFMWHKVIVSSTEWENFFAQRCSPLAQPEVRVVAEHMRHAMSHSDPSYVHGGEVWHAPYVSKEEAADWGGDNTDVLKISAARCARVSYLTHDGVRDPARDIELYDKLVSAKPAHWSPLEHVAAEDSRFIDAGRDNFRGWTQLRTLVQAGWTL